MFDSTGRGAFVRIECWALARIRPRLVSALPFSWPHEVDRRGPLPVEGGDHGGGLAEPAFREGDDVDEVVGSDGGVLRLHALHLQHECSQ